MAEFGNDPGLFVLFEEVARDASERGKGFGWVIGAVRGRINDARNPVMPTKRVSLADQVRDANAPHNFRESLTEQASRVNGAHDRRERIGLADQIRIPASDFAADFPNVIQGEATVIPKGEA